VYQSGDRGKRYLSRVKPVNALFLARSKARKRQSDDAIDMISNNDSDSRILDFSPACLKSTGKSSPTISAKPVGVGAASQPLIPTGERLLTRICRSLATRPRLSFAPDDAGYVSLVEERLLSVMKMTNQPALTTLFTDPTETGNDSRQTSPPMPL
jgi:hypothetical protein